MEQCRVNVSLILIRLKAWALLFLVTVATNVEGKCVVKRTFTEILTPKCHLKCPHVNERGLLKNIHLKHAEDAVMALIWQAPRAHLRSRSGKIISQFELQWNPSLLLVICGYQNIPTHRHLLAADHVEVRLGDRSEGQQTGAVSTFHHGILLHTLTHSHTHIHTRISAFNTSKDVSSTYIKFLVSCSRTELSDLCYINLFFIARRKTSSFVMRLCKHTYMLTAWLVCRHLTTLSSLDNSLLLSHSMFAWILYVCRDLYVAHWRLGHYCSMLISG